MGLYYLKMTQVFPYFRICLMVLAGWHSLACSQSSEGPSKATVLAYAATADSHRFMAVQQANGKYRLGIQHPDGLVLLGSSNRFYDEIICLDGQNADLCSVRNGHYCGIIERRTGRLRTHIEYRCEPGTLTQVSDCDGFCLTFDGTTVFQIKAGRYRRLVWNIGGAAAGPGVQNNSEEVTESLSTTKRDSVDLEPPAPEADAPLNAFDWDLNQVEVPVANRAEKSRVLVIPIGDAAIDMAEELANQLGVVARIQKYRRGTSAKTDEVERLLAIIQQSAGKQYSSGVAIVFDVRGRMPAWLKIDQTVRLLEDRLPAGSVIHRQSAPWFDSRHVDREQQDALEQDVGALIHLAIRPNKDSVTIFPTVWTLLGGRVVEKEGLNTQLVNNGLVDEESRLCEDVACASRLGKALDKELLVVEKRSRSRYRISYYVGGKGWPLSQPITTRKLRSGVMKEIRSWLQLR